MNIFVKNLSDNINAVILESLFKRFGEVGSAKVIYDRHTGESRGFGFVDMPNDEEAKKAIETLNEYELDGEVLEVSEAEPPQKKFKIRF